MKTLGILSGLLIIGLQLQCGLAESERKPRQAYLPPRANSAPITEEYITIREEQPGSQGRFQESSYGDSSYQIFEVHSHYEPTASFNPQPPSTTQHFNQAGGSDLAAISPRAPAVPATHSSVPNEEIIRVQHIHVNVDPVSNSAGHQTGFKAPDYLPPLGGNDVASLPQTDYRAPDYLPPHTGANLGQHHQHGNQHQSHQQQQQVDIHQGQQQFSAPDYLPPVDVPSHQHHQGHQHQHQQQQQQHDTDFRGPDYLPPHHDQHISTQSTHFTDSNHFLSHQSVNQLESHQQVGGQQVEQFRGPDYLPPHQNSHVGQQQGQQVQFNGQHNGQVGHQEGSQAQFKGPDYLPPLHDSHNGNQQGQISFNGHHEEQIGHQQGSQGQFKGPDYLPPHHDSLTGNQLGQISFNGHHEEQIGHQQGSQGQFKGPDYLPPIHESQTGNQQGPAPFSGHHEEQIGHQHGSQGQFKGPDYLPPHHETHHHHEHSQNSHHNQFKGPDYLPPHHDAVNGNQQGHQAGGNGHHEGQIAHQHGSQTPFKGPDYLPPHHEQHHASHHQVQQQFIQSTQYKGPDYLPPHGPNNIRQPGTLPSGYEFSNPEAAVSSPQEVPSQPLQAPQQLPPGYDFEKPENAEQAIAELHSLQNDQQQEIVVQSQIQVAQGNQRGQGSSIIYGHPAPGANYQHNGYLPPENSARQSPSSNFQVQQSHVQTQATATSGQQLQGGLQQVAPQTFGPAPVNENAAQPAATNFPPLARPVQADQFTTNLHSLSTYMSTVQPFERYGDAQFTTPRRPFREYGPPPSNAAFSGANVVQQQQQHNHQHHHQQQPQQQRPQSVQQFTIAPMYREQASRSPYYAPAMSYASNAVANSFTISKPTHQQHQHHQHAQSHSFSQQTRHNLQQLMPAEVHIFNPAPASAHAPAPAPAPIPRPALIPTAAAVSGHQPPAGKIRTVQIVNPTAVKTLKVLETSDHAGVKTIKILGHTNTNPTGEHRVIKVVTQHGHNNHEHVQTVKIFNDHAEAPRAIGGGGGASAANAYLPPRARVIRQSPLKLQLISKSKQRRPFTGRRRYRA